MKLSHLTTSILAAGFLIACGDVQNAANDVKGAAQEAKSEVTKAAKEGMQEVKSAAKEGMEEVKKAAKPSRPGVDIGTAPSGTYKSEAGHAYIAFTYSHQGYSNPILRWGEFDATLELNSENPEASTLMVTIPAASIDSGVEDFDKHLVSADFFDVENYPTITFKSTDMRQIVTGTGTVTGDLTIKGMGKPLTLNTTLNKVGKHFRNGKDMFGISATANLRRSEYGVDKYGPMGDDVKLTIEVEFQKED